MTTSNPLIRCIKPRENARIRLYCIPYAGGGASIFRLWQESLPSIVEVHSIQLPGRENRLMETPFDDAREAARAVADAMEPDLDRSYAVFGHSMGALIAFELLRELQSREARQAGYLFASAFRAPQVPNPDPAMHDLPDAELLDEIDRRYDAVPAAARESEELLELILPGIRGDTTVCDSYSYRAGTPLACPIAALGGESDPIVRPELLEPWREHTSEAFDLTLFPGDHFYLQPSQAELLKWISTRLLTIANDGL